MRSASVLIKPASSLCNMHCDYCFYCDEAAKREAASFGMMEEDTLKAVIRQTLPKTTHQYSLAFQGGEPTLRGLSFYRSAVDMLHRYNKNGAKITLAMQTNGVLIDDAWARFFAENGFLLGLSVDGTKALHDARRHINGGGSAFDAAVQAAKLMDQYRVPYNILTVVHRETAAHIREIYYVCQQRGWHYLQFIACLEPLHEGRGQAPWALTPKAYGSFLVELFDLWYNDTLRGRAPSIRQFDNWLGMLLGYPPEACEQCGVCGMQYVVEADGSVYPCDFYVLDDWRLGSFALNSLEQIDERREALSFRKRSQPLPEKCQACPHVFLCRNGCFRQREEGINYFCDSYRMFFDQCGKRLAALAEKMKRSGGAYG